MAISVGDTLPGATLSRIGSEGPEAVEMASLTKGRKVVIFGLPGAYTGTCTSAHVPSFMRTKAGFDDKGVDEIICISVNDPFVMGQWGEISGAKAAGIRMLGDADGSFTKALGLDFDGSAVGLGVRATRFSALVANGMVKILNVEDNPGEAVCTLGEALVDQI